jgi:hypothetical protein
MQTEMAHQKVLNQINYCFQSLAVAADLCFQTDLFEW